MTLMSSKKYSDLGSPEVHQRHAVMIEGGTVPRARVMDQTLIDRYLIDGLPLAGTSGRRVSAESGGKGHLHQATEV